MTATIDETAKTLGEFEALAQGTGEWDGADPVEFSIDGVAWLPVWAPVGDWTYPPFARAVVRRKGVATATTMIVAWAESVPADDGWRALWERKPMKLFGSFALRSAIRHAFRDVVGDRRGPDELQDGPTVGDPWAPVDVDRDWDADIAATQTQGEVLALHAEMKKNRAVTPAREIALRKRLAAVPEVLATPTPELSAGERIRSDVFFPPPVERPAPQDHLAGNRAARRAAKRKGRR